MVSSAGRGSPRPLLEGVFRKACDYCVKSKRGCNGGNPCEQCIRREQPCTYSQRRKSGPRGRPLRQQATSPCSVGTRTSARRTKGASSCCSSLDGSPEPSEASSTSSPARTSSVSSSPSDYSPSDDYFSDSETEPLAEKDQGKVHAEPEAEHQAKKSRISDSHDNRSAGQISPSFAEEAKPVSRFPIIAQTITTSKHRQKTTSEQPRVSEVSVASFVPSLSVAKRTVWPSRPHSPSIVAPPPLTRQRPTSGGSGGQPLPAAPGAPTTAAVPQQQQQQQLQSHPHPQRATVNMMEAPATSAPANLSIHEISMKPWEISTPGARPVVSESAVLAIESNKDNMHVSSNPSAGFTSQSLAGVDMDVTNMSMDVTAAAVPRADSAQAAALALQHVLNDTDGVGAFASQGDFKGDFSDVLNDIDFDTDCSNWQIPPVLTREISLARAVDALGGEYLAHGFGGLEGGSVSGW